MTTYPAQTTDPKAPEWARTGSRLCGGLVTLKDQLNAANPNRDKTSDGFLGDARHLAAGEHTDHNPWWEHLVRGGDFDKDGINAGWLAEQLRLVGAAGDPRLADGGYVIWNGHITTPDFQHWVPYVGDPHTGHVHVSLSRSAACDYTRPWHFLTVATPPEQPGDPGPIRPAVTPPTPAPAPEPVHWTGPDARGAGAGFLAELGDNGGQIQSMQHELNRVFPLYSKLAEDGFYGPKTAEVLAEFQHRAADDPGTPAADREGLAQSDGSNVGGRTARAFVRYGLNL